MTTVAGPPVGVAPPVGAPVEAAEPVQRYGLLRRWFPAALTTSFVMAGFFKDSDYLSVVPFDLTAALGVLTAVTVAVRLSLSTVPRQIHGIVLAFALLIPPTFLLNATEYGTEKVARLFTFTFLAIVAPVALIRDRRDVFRHLCCLVALGFVVVVTALLDPKLSSDYEGAPIVTESVNTIQLGMASGMVVVVLALGLIWKRTSWWTLVPAAAALYVLLQSGSRGPLISTVAAIFVGTLVTRARPPFRRTAVFGALLAVGVVVAYNAAPLYSQRRILGLLQGDTSGSVDGRVSLYQEAFQSFLDHPFGRGWGGFQLVSWGGYTYPHNMVLELLAEAGVVFGGLFLIWLYVQVLRAHPITDSFLGAVVFSVVVFWLGKTLVSGDLNDNREFFYALGVSIAARAVVARSRGGGSTLSRRRQRFGIRGHLGT